MELTLYDTAEHALIELASINEGIALRHTSQTIQELARRAGNITLELNACKYRLWCERGVGELLVKTVRAGGDRQSEKALSTADDNGRLPPGISLNQSSQWQQLAAIPRAEFEARIARLNVPLSSKTLLNNKRVVANTGEYEWYTPPKYIELSRDVMGAIDLDPASCAAAQEWINAGTYYTRGDDGLDDGNHWHGRVWLNPPYCQPDVALFTQRLLRELVRGTVTQAVLLSNNSTDTEWFQSAARRADIICFTTGRVKFINAGKSSMPVKGQAFFYFGDRVRQFATAFGEIGLLVRHYRSERPNQRSK